MTENILKQYGFKKWPDNNWALDFGNPGYSTSLWYEEGKMYIAGPDAPNNNYATLVRCNDEQDLKEIINVLTRK